MNMNKENKTEEFIKRAISINGPKYDYSKVKYSNSKNKIIIICSEHGQFNVTPDNHINKKSGCPKCNGGVRLSSNEFIEKSNKAHNNKYDYSLVEYKNNITKITIICPEHNRFQQRPQDHLNKLGCPKCGINKRANSRTSDTEEFIKKATSIHETKYDYSKVKYKKSNLNVTIICKQHGEFKQKPNDHLSNKNGCPICSESKGEIAIRKFLTENSIEFISQKRFKDCKDKRTLPFDFYLPKINLCIEYDGIQHFNKKNRYYSDDRKKKDEIKNQYCTGINDNPKLLRISYLDVDNINQILTNSVKRQKINQRT